MRDLRIGGIGIQPTGIGCRQLRVNYLNTNIQNIRVHVGVMSIQLFQIHLFLYQHCLSKYVQPTDSVTSVGPDLVTISSYIAQYLVIKAAQNNLQYAPWHTARFAPGFFRLRDRDYSHCTAAPHSPIISWEHQLSLMQ